MLTENRSCKYCKKPIPLYNRADSVFCSEICRKAHWEENNTRGAKALGRGSSHNIDSLETSGFEENANK